MKICYSRSLTPKTGKCVQEKHLLDGNSVKMICGQKLSHNRIEETKTISQQTEIICSKTFDIYQLFVERRIISHITHEIMQILCQFARNLGHFLARTLCFDKQSHCDNINYASFVIRFRVAESPKRILPIANHVFFYDGIICVLFCSKMLFFFFCWFRTNQLNMPNLFVSACRWTMLNSRQICIELCRISDDIDFIEIPLFPCLREACILSLSEIIRHLIAKHWICGEWHRAVSQTLTLDRRFERTNSYQHRLFFPLFVCE